MRPPRPKIGWLAPSLYEMGGTETWYRMLWPRLDPHEVDNCGLVVMDPAQCHRPTATALSAYAPVKAGLSAARTLAEKVDVLVVWGLDDLKPLFFRPPAYRPAVVWVCHSDANNKWAMDRLLACQTDVDQFVAVSKVAAECVPKRRAAQCTVIENGIDREGLQRDLYMSDNPEPIPGKVLGFLGRISPEKHPELLIDALEQLHEDWTGLYVGKNYLGQEIVDLAEQRVPGRVTFLGSTSHVADRIKQMTVLLSASEGEGFGYAIGEAWALGTPVVSTLVGIAHEHPDCVAGLPLNPTALHIARAVNRVVGMPVETAKQCQKAMDLTIGRYTVDRFTRAWLSYLKLVARSGKFVVPAPGDVHVLG